LEALLDAGKVYVNGIKIPAEADVFSMNGNQGIWQDKDGHWTWMAHDKLNSDRRDHSDSSLDFSYEFARRRFVIAVSALRGMKTTIWAEQGKNVSSRVEFEIKSGGQVEKIFANNDTTTVYGVPIDATSYDTDGGPNDRQPRTLPTANFDKSSEEGETVLYWYDDDGWHMERAIPVQGIMTATDHFNINVDGKKYSDALIVRYNMQEGSRPSQVILAVNTLEPLKEIPITLWNTDTGYVVGLSHMEYADDALKAAIDYVEKYASGNNIIVSTAEDGAFVGQNWVTQEVMDNFDNFLAIAKSVLANPDSSNAQMDAATQHLQVAFGRHAGLDGAGKPVPATGLLGMVPGTK
jgi:hypothetical protein